MAILECTGPLILSTAFHTPGRLHREAASRKGQHRVADAENMRSWRKGTLPALGSFLGLYAVGAEGTTAVVWL
jgi:hypothetical protein